jgi:hypothetical protein
MRANNMTLTPFWLIPNQILVHDYGESPTDQDVLGLVTETCAYLDRATHPIYMIADWRHATRVPLNFDMIGLISKMIKHRNVDTIFILGITPLLSFWIDVYARVTGFRWKKANNYDEVVEAVSMLETAVH